MNSGDLVQLKKEMSKRAKNSELKRTRTSPLGKLFNEIVDFTDTETRSNETVYEIYSKLPESEKNSLSPCGKRLAVIRHLLQYLEKIHDLTPRSNRTDIIAIPLYDMKIVVKVLNLIVVEGVYSCLPPKTGVPDLELPRSPAQSTFPSMPSFPSTYVPPGSEIPAEDELEEVQQRLRRARIRKFIALFVVSLGMLAMTSVAYLFLRFGRAPTE